LFIVILHQFEKVCRHLFVFISQVLYSRNCNAHYCGLPPPHHAHTHTHTVILGYWPILPIHQQKHCCFTVIIVFTDECCSISHTKLLYKMLNDSLSIINNSFLFKFVCINQYFNLKRGYRTVFKKKQSKCQHIHLRFILGFTFFFGT
jgi:hypothetical protein